MGIVLQGTRILLYLAQWQPSSGVGGVDPAWGWGIYRQEMVMLAKNGLRLAACFWKHSSLLKSTFNTILECSCDSEKRCSG